MPFTPWASIDDYLELLDWIEDEDLSESVDPVQLSIRLLIPPGSPLAELETLRPHLRGLRRERFGHDWSHPDPRMDRLHAHVAEIVREAATSSEPADATFPHIRAAALAAAGRPVVPAPTRFLPARAAAAPPRLTEPWFC